MMVASVMAMTDDKVNVLGYVKDKKTMEPLIGASVALVGTTIGTITDEEGNFMLRNVKDGTYDIEVSYIGYQTIVRKSIHISPDSVVVLNTEMEEEPAQLHDIVIVAKVSKETETATLQNQKRSVTAVQTIGSKELSRKGVSDAQAAVTKVSGISQQEGVKNVFVRGLGDRYNSTTLNGFPIPSEDPEYKNIALDFFATDMIQAIDVNKAFTGHGVSDVGGAHIDILSKELNAKREFSIGVSGGLNTKTVGADFLKLDGVNAFGFSNNTYPSDNLMQYSFKNKLDPSVSHAQIDQSYSLSAGRKFDVAGNPLSLFLIATHSKDYSYYEEEVRNSTTSGRISQDQTGKKSNVSTSQLVLANADYKLLGKHDLGYNFMMVHASTSSVGDYTGMNSDFETSDDYTGFMRRQQTNDNLLFVNQFSTRWQLTDKLDFDAGAAYNHIKGLEPDRRINHLVNETEGYLPQKGTGIQQRYFSELKEKDWNARAGLAYKLPDRFNKGNSEITLGYRGRFVDDDFVATEYDLSANRQPVFNLDDIHFDEYFTQEHLDEGYFRMDKNTDSYGVKKTIHTAFLEATYQFTSKFIADLGLKYDDVLMKVDYNVNRGGTRGNSEIDKSYFLPSLNLRYNFNDEHSLRLGASKTYTLPQAKEISPFRYTGVSFNSQGNQNLKPSDNYNIDLKWDYYISPSEILTVTGFYKYIKNPISRIEIASAGGYLTYDNIADHATVAGIEVEFRKNLFARPLATGGLNRLSIGVNGSYIYTHAKVPLATDPSGSQLEGAAPWIVNVDLSHHLTAGKRTFINTLVFNYFSDRVYTIGTEGYQDTMEKGVPTLDFISSAKLNSFLTLSFKARNLLNSVHQLTREPSTEGQEVVLSKYRKGRDFSLGLTASF